MGFVAGLPAPPGKALQLSQSSSSPSSQRPAQRPTQRRQGDSRRSAPQQLHLASGFVPSVSHESLAWSWRGAAVWQSLVPPGRAALRFFSPQCTAEEQAVETEAEAIREVESADRSIETVVHTATGLAVRCIVDLRVEDLAPSSELLNRIANDASALLERVARHPEEVHADFDIAPNPEEVAESELEISLVLCSDLWIRELNRTWREKDYVTDVLSFPQDEGTALGDIVISLDRAGEQARERNYGLQDEIRILMVHGMLHLLGYDHELGPSEWVEMAAAEQRLISSLGWVGAGLIAAAGGESEAPPGPPRPSGTVAETAEAVGVRVLLEEDEKERAEAEAEAAREEAAREAARSEAAARAALEGETEAIGEVDTGAPGGLVDDQEGELPAPEEVVAEAEEIAAALELEEAAAEAAPDAPPGPGPAAPADPRQEPPAP
eukprot:tig00001574_g9352.t1